MKTPEGWKHENNKLVREFRFENFVESVNFVNRIVPLAESAQHHPDIEIYGYRNVRISLSTHDAGNVVTEKDLDLARQINELPG